MECFKLSEINVPQIYNNPRKSILAVDNALMFLNSMKKILANSPYKLSCETSAQGALALLDTNFYDLILLDVEMPEMDGYELTGRIKQRGIKTPILIISANTGKEDIEKAEKAGAAGFLPKPFRPKQLIEKIKEFI